MGGRIAGGTARTQTMVLTWDVCVPIVLEPGHHNMGPFSFIVAMKASVLAAIKGCLCDSWAANISFCPQVSLPLIHAQGGYLIYLFLMEVSAHI